MQNSKSESENAHFVFIPALCTAISGEFSLNTDSSRHDCFSSLVLRERKGGRTNGKCVKPDCDETTSSQQYLRKMWKAKSGADRLS